MAAADKLKFLKIEDFDIENFMDQEDLMEKRIKEGNLGPDI